MPRWTGKQAYKAKNWDRALAYQEEQRGGRGGEGVYRAAQRQWVDGVPVQMAEEFWQRARSANVSKDRRNINVEGAKRDDCVLIEQHIEKVKATAKKKAEKKIRQAEKDAAMKKTADGILETVAMTASPEYHARSGPSGPRTDTPSPKAHELWEEAPEVMPEVLDEKNLRDTADVAADSSKTLPILTPLFSRNPVPFHRVRLRDGFLGGKVVGTFGVHHGKLKSSVGWPRCHPNRCGKRFVP